MTSVIDLNNFCEMTAILNSNEDEKENLLKKYNLINKNQVCNNNYYTLLKYDKKLLSSDNYETLGKFRSIIYRNQQILSFSPPKAIAFQEFVTRFNIEDCYAEEFIEGTMINVFYDQESSHWEIATRSCVGAEVYFFPELPFNKMFHEVCALCNLDLNLLEKKFCYTFVFQHPKNRIVMPISYPLVYLIRVYSIDQCIISEINLEQFYQSFKDNNPDTILYIPVKYPILCYKELEDFFASMNTPYYIPGIMIYNKNGERTKLRNPTYEDIRFLRGNQPKLQYQYLVLRKENRIKDFLMYYPEYRTQCSVYRDQLHRYTHNLYNNYVNCYIYKKKILKEFPHEYKIHMFNLHKLYLDELRGNSKVITKSYVIEYINGLEPAQILYLLNYNLRQRHYDEEKILIYNK